MQGPGHSYDDCGDVAVTQCCVLLVMSVLRGFDCWSLLIGTDFGICCTARGLDSTLTKLGGRWQVIPPVVGAVRTLVGIIASTEEGVVLFLCLDLGIRKAKTIEILSDFLILKD